MPSSSLGLLHSLLPSTSRSHRPRRPSPSHRGSRRASVFKPGPFPLILMRPPPLYLPEPPPFCGPHPFWPHSPYFNAHPFWPIGATQAVRRRWLPRPSPAGPTRSTRPAKTSAGCLTTARPPTTSVGHSTHQTSTASARPTSPSLPHRRPSSWLTRFIDITLTPHYPECSQD